MSKTSGDPVGDYPSEEQLEKIRTWPYADAEGLRRYVFELWHWADYATVEGGMWRLATGGWSGNEEIVRALNDNTMFWILSWQRSERGGLYWFKPPGAKDGQGPTA